MVKKVFFGCSMKGGYPSVGREELSRIPRIIEEQGHNVISHHQTQMNWRASEAELSNTTIHERDYEWLLEADLGIFEISNPSLGTGAEISDLVSLGKPVLCLYKKGLEEEVSSYILGKEGSRYVKGTFETACYEDEADLKNIIGGFIEGVG